MSLRERLALAEDPRAGIGVQLEHTSASAYQDLKVCIRIPPDQAVIASSYVLLSKKQ